MRKAFANLLITDVQLIRENKLNYTKGKIMFTDNNQVLSINTQLSTKQGTAVATNGINATHYYLKFMPRNDADYALLKRDSNLIIYPFPLDNENVTYKGNYRDPAVADGIPTYQYAAVPISYVLPAVPYQKIEDLYLPDEQSKNSQVTVKGDGGSSFTVSVQQLVNQAFCDGDDPDNPPTESKAATNNNVLQANIGKPSVISLLPPEEPEPCEGGDGGSYPPGDPYSDGESWRPNGRITMNDDFLGTIGVEGIKVRARRWFTTYTGITDANGYYAVDGWYTRPANYSFDFERYDFSVNDHRGGPQSIGPYNLKSPWNFELANYDKFCGTIFRAAYHYYYKDIQGLRRPPLNSFWSTQVKLAAFDWYENKDNGDMWAGRNILFGSLIHIYHPQNGSMETYATTIHELAHASHWNMSSQIAGSYYTKFGASDLNLVESWATGVQWVLTKMEYPDYYGRINGSKDYTNIVMDMIDNPGEVFYQQVFRNGVLYQYQYGTGSPIDEVGYYTIVQLENALRNQTTLTEWKTNLYNNYGNPTKQNLDPLFSHYINLP
jgi:hypothetical protein